MEDVLKKLNEEENANKLSTILDKIAEGKIKVDDCSQIINFLDDRRAAVRHSAIQALRVCKSPLAEEALIKILKESAD